MPYRAPGAYARFVRTAGPVSNPGGTRTMALIGTGLNYFEVYNEAIQKDSGKPYETLAHNNVFEIISISDKPTNFGKSTLGATSYQQGDDKAYTLKDGNKISWNFVATKNPTFTKNYTSPSLSGVTLSLDASNAYLAKDGNWLIEITYVDEDNATLGAYRVINMDTQEVIGEYPAGPNGRTGAIPGFLLTFPTTYIYDSVAKEVTSKVGDYMTITTVAGKTEVEATCTKSKPVDNGTDELLAAVTNLQVDYNSDVLTDSYLLTVVDPLAATISITRQSDKFELYNGILTPVIHLPGISFVIESLPEDSKADDTVLITTVARSLGTAPAENTIYYVSYKYRKADVDYSPKIFFNYDDVVEEYGNYDVTASGVIINSLSLGAEIAMQNGAVPVICVQALNNSDYEMNKAIDLLKRTLPSVDNVQVIIPLTDSANVGAYAQAHVNFMSSEDQGKERMTYLGAKIGQALSHTPTMLDTSLGMMETAKSYNDERVVYVVPGEVVREVKDLRTGKINDRVLPSCYAAIAVAAVGLTHDPAEPLTNKNIAGFKSLKTMFSESEKNLLAGAGCLVLDQRGSVIKIRHGITTSSLDVNSNEITLIQIKDYVIGAARTIVGQLYIGNKNRPSIVSDIQYTLNNILSQFISQQIILGVNGLSVKRNKDNPTQIDVRFEIEAVYPLNYINITFGFAAVS